jgi:hypothetical protein
MYPPKFDYYRAGSVAEALSLKQQHGGKFLAGGHSLIPVMNLRLADPGVVIDIGRLPESERNQPEQWHSPHWGPDNTCYGSGFYGCTHRAFGSGQLDW